jgi:hypothetical protein
MSGDEYATANGISHFDSQYIMLNFDLPGSSVRTSLLRLDLIVAGSKYACIGPSNL